jgi:hypothetical protein
LDAPEEVAQGLHAHKAAALDFNMIPQDLDALEEVAQGLDSSRFGCFIRRCSRFRSS